MEINHYLSYFVCLGKRGQDHVKCNGFMEPCIIQNISIMNFLLRYAKNVVWYRCSVLRVEEIQFSVCRTYVTNVF